MDDESSTFGESQKGGALVPQVADIRGVGTYLPQDAHLQRRMIEEASK